MNQYPDCLTMMMQDVDVALLDEIIRVNTRRRIANLKANRERRIANFQKKKVQLKAELDRIDTTDNS